MTLKRTTYKDAGIDVAAGDALVKRIAPLAKATARKGANAVLGGFGGLFDLKAAGFRDPLLVASTDGVGTKLKIAIEMGRFDSVGQDLVAMCVNDIVVQGAEPLFFLDYYATASLDLDQAARVLEGVSRACKESGCALIGGETSEMPGMYGAGDFDLAGFAVGAVEREHVLPKSDAMKAGDALIGVHSSGIHANGFSLVRRVVETAGLAYSAPAPFAKLKTLGETLLTPTRLYVKSALSAIAAGGVKGFAHITGGGITGNLPRVLPDALDAEIDLNSWKLSPVFAWLAREAGLEQDEMLSTFNCRVGMIAVVDAAKADAVIAAFEHAGEIAHRIGTLVPGKGEPSVRYHGTLSAG
ncbi:MAG: phosphoribosylformylglycinamidine cyclo-ligase [Alphaproteobacteria bacterium]